VTSRDDRPTLAVTAYGWTAYLLALAAIATTVGFLANVGLPLSIDSGSGRSLGSALLVDVGLLGLFAVQHSLMARPWFKARWTRLVPRPIERSTYVLLASLALLVTMALWVPLPRTVWEVHGPAATILWAGFVGGWLLVFAGVYAIDKDDLMGLRQVEAYVEGREPAPLDFQTPTLYRYLRHPIMTGFILAFWVTPHMTVGHLVFASGMTAYVLAGVWFEERDLVRAFGDRYRRYRSQVPMFVPRPWRVLPTPENEGTDGRPEGTDGRPPGGD